MIPAVSGAAGHRKRAPRSAVAFLWQFRSAVQRWERPAAAARSPARAETVAVAQNHQSGRIVVSLKEILLTVRRCLALRPHAGRAQGQEL